MRAEEITNEGALNVLVALVTEARNDLQRGIQAMYGTFGRVITDEEWFAYFKNNFSHRTRYTEREQMLQDDMRNYYSARRFFRDDPYQALGENYTKGVEKLAFDANLRLIESEPKGAEKSIFETPDVEDYVKGKFDELKEKYEEYLKWVL